MATFTPFETNHEPHLLLMLEDVTERILADQKLQEANGRLERLAREDGLTGLANRRHFNERLEAEIRRTRRVGKGLALITCDIDYFKRYNDNYGHPMGDACLITVSKVMQGLFKRGGDLVARIGGEEFAILLPETQLEAATKLAEALRLAVESAGIPHEYSKIAPVITISLGVAAASVEEERSSEWFMGEADGALYRSKVGGRNRVSIGESTLENLG
jgi:diguanylate cyclase (GGDEF)-like protein